MGDVTVTLQHILPLVSYTFSSLVVLCCIVFLLRSLCSSSGEEAPQATSDQNQPDVVSQSEKPGDKLIFWISITGIVLFFLRSIVMWFAFLIVLITGHEVHEAEIANDITFIFYALALWIMTLTFALRIDYGFRNTFLAYHPMAIRVLYGIAMVTLLCTLVLSVFIAIDRALIVFLWMGPAILALNLVFCVLMIYMLFRKVFVVMTLKFDQAVSDRTQNASTENEEKVSIIRLDNINAFTRYALLIVTGLISTYLFLIISIVGIWNEWEHNGTLLRLDYVFTASDLTVNAMVLFLLFPMADKWYYMGCNMCHDFVRGCCIDCVYRNVLKQKETDKDKMQFAELILSNPL